MSKQLNQFFALDEASEIESLRQQLAAMTQERDELSSRMERARAVGHLAAAEGQLAEAQAVNAQMREALQDIATQCNGQAYRIASEALALHSDRSALDAAIADELARVIDPFFTKRDAEVVANRAKELREKTK